MTLEHNLILHPDGTLTCKDGRDVKEYLAEFVKNKWQTTESKPVAILYFPWYKQLLQESQFNSCA